MRSTVVEDREINLQMTRKIHPVSQCLKGDMQVAGEKRLYGFIQCWTLHCYKKTRYYYTSELCPVVYEWHDCYGNNQLSPSNQPQAKPNIF